jgi:CheY-like chemotaxis protein
LARKILLADDSVTAQNMGRKILADAGYDVVTVNNGSAALKRIAEIKPDLIVLDVYMPGYSGLEVCQRLKDAPETAHIPVLLTVGKLEPFKAEEARRVRADAHIVKPFEASELLTAITRLEDRMVPQKSGEGDASADTGWASRLSFPSKKKKAAAEPEEVAAGAGFRDFRKGKGKASAGGASSAASAPPVQDPVPVPDIPNDITPEELDALSALAAKLDGSTSAAEDTAPPAKQQFESPAAVVEPPVEPTIESAVEPIAESLDATLAVAPVASAVEEKNEFQIPVENLQAAVEGCEPVADAAAVEVPKPDLENSESLQDSESFQDSKSSEDSESQHPETPAPIIAVSAAYLAQEPAPVDSDDEPMFASATSAVEQAAEESTVDQASEAEDPAPTDAELAEALRLLTPATEHTDGSTIPSRGTLVAAGQLLAEEAARHAAAGPRWVAEPVALSPEEAAISLEAEMFRTFAAMPMTMTMSASSSAAEPEAAPVVGVSAIAAAVENRLAEAGLAASSSVSPDGVDSRSETTANQASAEAPAETMAVAPEATSPVVEEVEAEKTQQQDSLVNVAEQVPAEELVKEELVTEKLVPEELVKAAEEAPKAMAAAAAADGGVSATDANAIADIVDSMLADLRPKLLEEIAKKMARK